MKARKGWSAWCEQAMRWLRRAGVLTLTAALGADLMALYERDYEPQEAAFVLMEEVR